MIWLHNAEPEITARHWTFSDQKYRMSGHFEIWSDIFVWTIFWFFVDFKVFPIFYAILSEQISKCLIKISLLLTLLSFFPANFGL